MHKYNKALRSGLGCSSALWRNEGDWRCMCPGIGTGRDPSSPNYPHSRCPCGTLCLDIYICGCSHTHGCTAHTAHYMSLPVVRDITEQFYAAWHHLAENKSIFNNYDDGEAKRNSLKAAGKSLLGGAENPDNADLSSSQKILGCYARQQMEAEVIQLESYREALRFSDNSTHMWAPTLKPPPRACTGASQDVDFQSLILGPQLRNPSCSV